MLKRYSFAGLALLVAMLMSAAAFAGTLEFHDPEGDDNGPGTYTYPTDRAYTRGAFDITAATVEWDDDTVEFQVEVNQRIEDPWNSPEWNGNGFSVQFVQVYIDMDRDDPSGHTRGLPGINVNFEPGWNKVVLISPQPSSRVQAELDEKAADMAADAIIPERTSARGRRLIARVPRSAFGDSDPATWGYQFVMQSNEGYPTARDILTRRVNEFEGPHRFGGGNDLDCDPHVMDILAGEANGDASEIETQHTTLSAYVCDGTEEGTWATIGFVYR